MRTLSRHARSVILAWAAISCLPGVSQAQESYQLAVTSRVDGSGTADVILAVNDDGSGVVVLTPEFRDDQDPSWSPDGSKIVFVSRRNSHDEIFVMNADGSGQTNLTPSSPASSSISPSWSPDGSRIVYQTRANATESFELFVMNADGSGKTNLANAVAASYPTWSPDGSKIAMQSYQDGNFEIYVIGADGAGQTNLTNDPSADTLPVWSPGGSKIAFTSQRDGNYEVYVMNADGSGQTNVSTNAAIDSDPSWSPDGSRISFRSNRNGDYEIYLVDPDGANRVNFTNHPAGSDNTARWSPDGSRISFVRSQGGSKVYVKTLGGGDAIEAFSGPIVSGVPTWRPVPGPVVQTSKLVCEASVTPTLSRAEDLTARMGEITFSCTSDDPTRPAPDYYVEADVRVLLENSTITNNVNFGAGSDRVDAVLIVNESNCAAPSSDGGSFGCGGDYQDPQYGQLTGGNRVEWKSVRLPFPGAFNPSLGRNNPDVTTLRVASLRADARFVGPSPAVGEVNASYWLTSGQFEFADFSAPISYSTIGLIFDGVSDPVSALACNASGVGPNSITAVRLREGFSSAFRGEGSPSFFLMEGQESGYPAPGSNNGGGANGPTQIRLAVSGVPVGVDLYVPTTVGDNAGLTMTLKGNECIASGAASQVAVDPSGNAQLVYDICSATATKVERVDIPLTAAWTAGTPDLGLAKIEASFWPLVTDGFQGPSLSLPEPRFRSLTSDTPLPFLRPVRTIGSTRR